jgi:hypothetical protein
MPSRLWVVGYVVAGAIAFGGVVGAGLYLQPRLAAIDQETIRVDVPGNALIQLNRPGHYVIFQEYRADGHPSEARSVDGLRVTLESEGNRSMVPLVSPRFQSEYQIGNRAGQSWLAFDIDRPGRFRLIASLPKGATEPKAVLAISQGLMGSIFGSIFKALGIAAAGLAIAVVVLLVVNRARSKAADKP